jgi:hypothetical protein
MPEINPPMIIGAWLLTVVVTAIIFRIFFDIKKTTWYQQKQLDMLTKIAEKLGVEESEITNILLRK